MKIKIKARLEISDHDGYCSGSECEYKTEIITQIVELSQKKYESCLSEIDTNVWTQFLDTPFIHSRGSYYCENSLESIDQGIDKHDFKYTILSVKTITDEITD